MTKKEAKKLLKDYKDFLNKHHKGMYGKISDYSLNKYIKEQLFIADVSNRTFNTLKNIDKDTKPMVDRVSQKGYVMNEHDNREMKMRIDALKSVLYGC